MKFTYTNHFPLFKSYCYWTSRMTLLASTWVDKCMLFGVYDLLKKIIMYNVMRLFEIVKSYKTF